MEYILNNHVIYNADTGNIRCINVDNDDGVALTPVLNRILLLLVENQGRLVPREQFYDAVWQSFGKSGSSNTLNQYIGVLRQILDSRLEKESIITVPKLGYKMSIDLLITSSILLDTPNIHVERENKNSLEFKKSNPYKTILLFLKKLANADLLFFLFPFLLSLIIITVFMKYNLSPLYTGNEINMHHSLLIDSCLIYRQEEAPDEDDDKTMLKNIKSIFSQFNLTCTSGNVYYYFDSPKNEVGNVGNISCLVTVKKQEQIVHVLHIGLVLMIKNRKKIIFFTLGVLTAFILASILKNKEHNICQGLSTFYLDEKNFSYSYEIMHDIYLSNDGVGYLTLRGKLHVNDKDFTMSRTINFEYTPKKGGWIKFKVIHVFKNAQDNTSKQLTKKYFPFFTEDSTGYFRADIIDNDKVLISGSTGNLFVCSKKKT